MKKRMISIFVLTVIVCLISVSCLKGRQIKYPAGRDTKSLFGDGTYQIVSVSGSSGRRDVLSNEKYGTCVIEQVEKVFETKEKVYIIGTTPIRRHFTLYAVIELNNNVMTLCIIQDNPIQNDFYFTYMDEMIRNQDAYIISDLSDFTEEDYSVFMKMKTE